MAMRRKRASPSSVMACRMDGTVRARANPAEFTVRRMCPQSNASFSTNWATSSNSTLRNASRDSSRPATGESEGRRSRLLRALSWTRGAVRECINSYTSLIGAVCDSLKGMKNLQLTLPKLPSQSKHQVHQGLALDVRGRRFPRDLAKQLRVLKIQRVAGRGEGVLVERILEIVAELQI